MADYNPPKDAPPAYTDATQQQPMNPYQPQPNNPYQPQPTNPYQPQPQQGYPPQQDPYNQQGYPPQQQQGYPPQQQQGYPQQQAYPTTTTTDTTVTTTTVTYGAPAPGPVPVPEKKEKKEKEEMPKDLQKAKKMMEDGLFDIGEEIDACLLACCFPCCVYGYNYSNSVQCCNCCGFCVGCCCFPFICGCMRNNIQKWVYAREDGCCVGCLFHAVWGLQWLALAQELKVVRRASSKDANDWRKVHGLAMV